MLTNSAKRVKSSAARPKADDCQQGKCIEAPSPGRSLSLSAQPLPTSGALANHDVA